MELGEALAETQHGLELVPKEQCWASRVLHLVTALQSTHTRNEALLEHLINTTETLRMIFPPETCAVSSFPARGSRASWQLCPRN